MLSNGVLIVAWPFLDGLCGLGFVWRGHWAWFVVVVAAAAVLPCALLQRVTGGVHAQVLCDGWVTLSANGRPKKPHNPRAFERKANRRDIDPGFWNMHDWVRLDTARLRLHHYKFRSQEVGTLSSYSFLLNCCCW